MVSIAVVDGVTLRSDSDLMSEIEGLVKPSYDDPSAILQREFQECTKLYLGRDASGTLACIYLTAWGCLENGSERIPMLHLGLSAAREDLKNHGAIRFLYARCVEEAIEWERMAGESLLLWSTTVSPTVYLAVARFLRDCEPRPDGAYTQPGAKCADALRKYLGHPVAEPEEHPFVLKGIAKKTRYSSAEAHRIQHVLTRKKFTLFSTLNVHEADHDRLLFIARTPSELRPR